MGAGEGGSGGAHRAKLKRVFGGGPRQLEISLDQGSEERSERWDEYRQIEELLGLDLDSEAIADLEEAARDRESGTPDAYVELDAI